VTLVAVVGSVTPPGRLRRAVAEALERAAGDTRLIDLAEVRIAFADGRPPDAYGDDTAVVVEAIATADAVLLATPVYRASLTGALKNLLDHVPVEALEGKPVGIAAMGATEHHYLGADRHLRDVLAWFGARVAPVGVYLTSKSFTDGVPTEAAAAELDALIAELTASGPGPKPLAARR
jgi:FMN reductase